MNKKIIIGLIVVGVICIAFFQQDINYNVNEDIVNNSQVNEDSNKDIETIYADDEAINLFLNKYNSKYEDKITTNMISKKRIGGKDRDDVITIDNDLLEINVYNNLKYLKPDDCYSISVFVGYKNDVSATSDDYKAQFKKFVKLLDETLTDEECDFYWEDMTSTYHSYYDIKDIEVGLQADGGNCTYFKLTRKIDL